MGYNLHDVLRKVVAYYKRQHENIQIDFLVMIWICHYLKKKKHWIYKESTHFQKFIFIQNDKQKKFHVLGKV